MKILAITTYPSSDASRRLRFDPIVESLRGCGPIRIHAIMTPRAFRLKNHRIGRYWSAATVALRSLQRMGILLFSRYDILVVHREALPFLTPWAERMATSRSRASLVDVDDAIYERPTHGADWRNLLRDPTKAHLYPKIFRIITVGNTSLFQDDGDPHSELLFFPTCPPEVPISTGAGRDVLWTGSESTLVNLEAVLEPTIAVCVRQDRKLIVLGGSNVSRLPRHPNLVVERWTEDRERAALGEVALGVMPLRDTPWDRGKSAYKAIRYLTAGVPALVSPIGMNDELAERFPAAVLRSEGDWESDLEAALTSSFETEAFREEVASARELFSIGKYVARISDMVRKVME